jgi:hypothetical protein
MKNHLLTIALLLVSLPIFCQFEASFSTGRFYHKLIPNAEKFNDMPYWNTDNSYWYSLKLSPSVDSPSYVLEFRLKHKIGEFSIFDGGQAGGRSVSVHYDAYRMDAEFRHRFRLFYPKFLYAEIGVFSGVLVKSEISGYDEWYVPPPFDQGNGTKQISGSA